jgi:hypothetical protein
MTLSVVLYVYGTWRLTMTADRRYLVYNHDEDPGCLRTGWCWAGRGGYRAFESGCEWECGGNYTLNLTMNIV